MYVYLNLPRLVSSPTTKHRNIRATKMHSTLQSQHESRESPSRHQISVDLVMFLESTVHFYHYMLNTFHMKDTHTLNHKPDTFYSYFSFILSSIPSCCHPSSITNHHLSFKHFVSTNLLPSALCLRTCHCPTQ